MTRQDTHHIKSSWIIVVHWLWIAIIELIESCDELDQKRGLCWVKQTSYAIFNLGCFRKKCRRSCWKHWFTSQASGKAAPGSRFPNRCLLWPHLGRGSFPRWSWGYSVGGAGCTSLRLPGAGPTASWALFCTVGGPGTGSGSAPGIAAAMGTSGQSPTSTTSVHAQGLLLLSELWFYSIRALICFLNKLLIENALVSAFHSVLFCM